uniref:Uncharacterized protein n=1 Tax=Oryza meridionalis TaxID=40149 RepID=A0A0E0DIE4_9ORYZ
MELSGDAAVVSGSGNRKRKRHVQQHSFEYPCVSRLRHRRLLAFLSRHDYDSTFDALVQETSVLFRVGHIQALVRQGRWADAASYVNRFVPPSRVLTDAGLVFHEFLYIHHVLDCIVAGDHLRGAQVAASYQRHVRDNPNPSHGAIKLIRILLTILHCHPIRAFLNWHLVRYKAAEIIKDLIPQIPEFNDLLKLPKGGPIKPHNILPIGSSSHRRRHVKNEDRIPAADIARFYLQKKRGLPSSTICQERYYTGLSRNAANWLADIVGVTGAPIGLDSPANSYGISTQTIADMMRPLIISDIGQGSVARNNPTRPETTAHQAISPTTQQITTEFVQHSESQFQEYNSQMDGRVRIVESGMKRSRSFGGGCSSSVEISS